LHAPGRIYALAIATLAGRPVAVSSGWDGELWVWDLASGERAGEPLDDNYGDVQALVVSHRNGRQRVVCGGIDEPVLRVWDLDQRRLDRVLPSPAHVLALAPLPLAALEN
jgi:WD40 repeat protein